MSDSSEAPAAPDFPREGRLLGIDFGTKRLGISVSTYEQTISSPLESYTRRNPAEDEKRLLALIDEYRIVGLVVGLPVHISGDDSESARKARAFGDALAKASGRPVRYWDERFSSTIAEGHLLSADVSRKKRKAMLDKLAAQIILQHFLDAPDREKRPEAM